MSMTPERRAQNHLAASLVEPNKSNIFVFYDGLLYQNIEYCFCLRFSGFLVNGLEPPKTPEEAWRRATNFALLPWNAKKIFDFIQDPNFVPTEWDQELIEKLLYKFDKTFRKAMLDNGYGRRLHRS